MISDMRVFPRYLPFGDTALVVEFGDTIDSKINQKVFALQDAITKAKIQGVDELVPTYRSLLIRYNPLKKNHDQLISEVKNLANRSTEPNAKTARKIIIPVVYGEEYGPDLNSVANWHGLTEEQVVKMHSEKEYRVYMIGFVAGFPYLGEVANEIVTPRLETPRLKVTAGSVGIAEKQTGIYPCEAPGGWRIIGRTSLKLFDPKQEPPALLNPGDTVKFKPITETEYKASSRTEYR
ncbi:MAG TPA: 5-oxoprolinase subunit PxpB [Candidatus Bathyarchaeia archaeon]|nr:5-oxoprolinase subunit PxpB [Candidatus Bathyarchaeia archaeon]